jgi:predicted TIM-barrel fold metal-dependent hydrolase
MSARPPIIDADGHVLDREQDVRRYLQPPWDKRPGPLFPIDQPWDTTLFGKLPEVSLPPELTYRHGLSPEEQVDLWHRIMEHQGIEYAVCFPTRAGAVPHIRERDFQIAVARACNDHFAKEYNARSERVRCVGVLPMTYPEAAAEELHRAVTELGLISFEILTTGTSMALGDPIYDPIYAEAERLGVALCIHGTRSWAEEVGAQKLRTFAEVHAYAFPAALQLHFTSVLCQGVPVRFPNLRLAFLEIGVTWLPYYLDRLDEHWEKRGPEEMPHLAKPPSETAREAKLYFSIEAGESQLAATVDYLGEQHFVYASDIPHWDNEFPESLEQLWEHPTLSAAQKQKIMADNARALFGLGTPAAV